MNHLLSDSKLVLDAIRRIIRSLRSFSKAAEKDLGLSTAQIYVLQKLAESHHALSINELAEATLTHQSSVSAVVSKLEGRKLIARTEHETDTRSVRISLTSAGKYLLGKSPEAIQDRLMVALAKMSPKVRKGLVVGLTELIANAGMQGERAAMLMEEES